MRRVAVALASVFLAAGPRAWAQKSEELAVRLVRVLDAID